MMSMTMPFGAPRRARPRRGRRRRPRRGDVRGALVGAEDAAAGDAHRAAAGGHGARIRRAGRARPRWPQAGGRDAQVARGARQRRDRLAVVDAAVERQPQRLGERQALDGQRLVLLQVLPAGDEVERQEEVDPLVGEAGRRPDPPSGSRRPGRKPVSSSHSRAAPSAAVSPGSSLPAGTSSSHGRRRMAVLADEEHPPGVVERARSPSPRVGDDLEPGARPPGSSISSQRSFTTRPS
jgi:hypothetical protein